MLSNEFKSKYCNTLDGFKSYVDELFDEKKIYNIQNYSNVDNVYVYRIRLLEDILATGTTDGYEYKEEKIAIQKENGVLKRLEELGIEEGDTVKLYNLAFDYYR